MMDETGRLFLDPPGHFHQWFSSLYDDWSKTKGGGGTRPGDFSSLFVKSSAPTRQTSSQD
ncbi:MAG: hypothetical protein HQL83_06705 [Magnetococcales bacterium]|nr:hypothetical protein [Magnetococcales bacterium]MBF0173121.1 hypothetical protein [Magnetococcales bacterium]